MKRRIEIKNVIKNLKNGKAAGCDNVPPEAIKAGGDTSGEVHLNFCNRVWTEEKIPEEWRKGLLIKLPKKGDLSYCKNWRGIMLLNMASKVFCRVILERIKIALDEKLKEEQAGFRAGRSCTGSNSNTADYCGAEHRVAVLLVCQLYRFRKGLR